MQFFNSSSPANQIYENQIKGDPKRDPKRRLFAADYPLAVTHLFILFRTSYDIEHSSNEREKRQ